MSGEGEDRRGVLKDGPEMAYNVERLHFGVGMDGKTPMEKLRELGFDLLDEFATFPVVLLDEVAG